MVHIKSCFIILLITLFAHTGKTQTSAPKKRKSITDTTDTPPILGNVFKPTIGFGAGTLSYSGAGLW